MQPSPSVPSCPRCNAPAVWHPQAGAWGCDYCRQMLPPPQQQMQVPPPQMAPPQMQMQMPPPQVQMHAPAPSGPACPRCGAPGVWHHQVNRWGCDRCRDYFDPPPVPMGPPPTAATELGHWIVKVLLFLLAIGIIVAIRVGLRQSMR